jgi:hypothetical protein
MWRKVSIEPHRHSAVLLAGSKSRLAFAIALALAGSAQARPRTDNMPRGWQWPPSKTMQAAAKACEDKLDEFGVSWKPAKAVGRLVDPITLSTGEIGGVTYVDVYHKEPLVMDCQLALALATFAPRFYELGVREVRVGSIYRFTKVRVGGKTKDLLSRHALGLALDVVSFVDDNGREAVVAKDYKQDDELLLNIERAIDDSSWFRTVLTPKNDPISHKDHFHIEADPDYSTEKTNT